MFNKINEMSLRRFYKRIETDETIQQFFFTLSKEEDEEDCLICYESNKCSDIVICEECQKPIHLYCIEKWFITNNLRKCPHCRSKWKFEIDIIEKSKRLYVELEEYSCMPNHMPNHIPTHKKLTVKGSISGLIEDRIRSGIRRPLGFHNINNNNNNSNIP